VLVVKWPWQKRKSWHPVVRPQYAHKISEFEEERLARTGTWLTINVQVMPNGGWCNWRHNVPEELRAEAKDALIALALVLQNKK